VSNAALAALMTHSLPPDDVTASSGGFAAGSKINAAQRRSPDRVAGALSNHNLKVVRRQPLSEHRFPRPRS
jgi:hypothetical protein